MSELYTQELLFFNKVFSTYFVIIGPIDLMVIFAILTNNKKQSEKVSIALRSCTTAFFILLFFTFFGAWLTTSIGISISALQTSGGLFLLLIAYNMVFDNNQSPDYGEQEQVEAKSADNISVLPLATPLLAGAGSMSATIIFSAEVSGDIIKNSLIILAFLLVLIISCILFITAGKLNTLLSATLINIITRVMGILLSALSLQFIFDGLRNSGLF